MHNAIVKRRFHASQPMSLRFQDMMRSEVLAIRPPKALKTHPRHPNGILLQFDQQDIHFKVAPSVLGVGLESGIKRLDLSSQAIQPHTLSRPGPHRLVAHSL